MADGGKRDMRKTNLPNYREAPFFQRLRSVRRLLYIDEEIFERIRDGIDYLP